MQKLEYYRIPSVCNDWFKSYLSHRKKLVPLNGDNFDLLDCGVPQGSGLGPHLDLYKAIKHYTVYHMQLLTSQSRCETFEPR